MSVPVLRNSRRGVIVPLYQEAKMCNDNGNRPCIFLVEEDDDTRPLLKMNLTRYGYRVTMALDEEDALQRLRGGHLQPI